MAKDNSGSSILKEAYQKGQDAFFMCEPNERGFYHNPTNPYPKNSLPSKEWERGYNRGFTDNKRRMDVC